MYWHNVMSHDCSILIACYYVHTRSSRDGSKRVNHTYMFQNEKTKMDWIGTLRYTKLKLSTFCISTKTAGFMMVYLSSVKGPSNLH